MATIEEIREMAEAFRAALDSLIAAQHPDAALFNTSGHFPRGCCGTIAEALALYLSCELGGEVEVVSAHDGNGALRSSHSWTRVGDINVDITGDQDGAPRVRVTTDPIWQEEYPFQDSSVPLANTRDQGIVYAVRSAMAGGNSAE